jgi:malonyl-CoA O-methyltransferase
MTLQPLVRLGGLASALICRVADRSRRVAAREAYALWADSYPPWAHNPLMQAEQQVMAPIIASTFPERALDVGTGSGRYLPLLAATGARLVVGVDCSLPMLTSAAARIDVSGRNQAGNLSPRSADGGARVCADARFLPFGDAAFDLISASLMVGDISHLAGWLDEMARVLAPGGHLIYSDFHPLWAAAGWRRTFRAADGRRIEIPCCSHAVADHVKGIEDARLDIRLIQEQSLAAEHLDRESGPNRPIVIVCHAVKPWS